MTYDFDVYLLAQIGASSWMLCLISGYHGYIRRSIILCKQILAASGGPQTTIVTNHWTRQCSLVVRGVASLHVMQVRSYPGFQSEYGGCWQHLEASSTRKHKEIYGVILGCIQKTSIKYNSKLPRTLAFFFQGIYWNTSL